MSNCVSCNKSLSYFDTIKVENDSNNSSIILNNNINYIKFNTTINIDKVVNTLDVNNCYICISCYDTLCLYYNKGILGLYDIIVYHSLLTSYKQLLLKYNNYIKKIIIYNNISNSNGLNTFIKLEEDLSIKYFNKHRSCLSIKEHIDILSIILKDNLVSVYFNIPIDFNEIKITDKFNDDLFRLNQTYTCIKKLESWNAIDFNINYSGVVTNVL